MDKQETIKGLNRFTKEELINIFSSLPLKVSDKKEILITLIVESDLSDDEIKSFKEKLVLKDRQYIVVHEIGEDGILYKKGRHYFGKFAEKFLEGGQIKIKE